MDTTIAGGVPSLHAYSEAIAAIVERLAASTVAVLGRRHALASGVVWRPGLVVTAAHVFRRTPAAATLVAAEGRRLEATLVGIDSATDLALFRLADAAALAPIAAGDAGSVRAGQLAIAVGRSGEGDALASHGIVNRAGGPWQTWLGGQVDRLIRLDGGVYDGLSGAPVADASGQVFGVATAALARGYGVVVPASTVSRVVDALAAGRRVARPWLGVAAQSVPLAGAEGKSGLLVTALADGGPAERAGVLVGDIVASAAGEPAGDLRALRNALASRVGQRVGLGIVRGGVPQDVELEVGEWPASGRRHC